MWEEGKDGRRALLDGAGSELIRGPLREHAEEFARLRGLARDSLQAIQSEDLAGCASWAERAKSLDSTVEEMESTRRQVEVQLRLGLSGGTADRASWDARLAEWSREAKELRAELEKVKAGHSRRSLRLKTLGHDADGSPHEGPEWQRVSQATELLERGSQRLEEARRQLAESEEVSHGILGDLASQRETIIRVRDNMATVSAELSAAWRSLDRLTRASTRNQIVTSVVGFMLALGLTFWALAYLQLPLRLTLIIAVSLLVAVSTALLLYRRLKIKRRAAAEEASSGSVFHRAAF